MSHPHCTPPCTPPEHRPVHPRRAGARTATAWARTLLQLACGLGAAAASAQNAPPAAVDASAAEPRMVVSGYQVQGNRLIAGERLDAVLLPMLGERTLAELERAAAAVQALYAEEGYGAVVAYVPPQTGQGGIVTIAVVEGKVRQIDAKGGASFTAERARAALPALREGQTPRLRDLDVELRLANENPTRQVQVLLKPGAQLGDTVAEVAVTEEPRLHRFRAELDNTGQPSNGRWRAALAWQGAALLGLDDVWQARLQTSPTHPSRVRVASVSTRVPWPAAHMAFDVMAAYSDVDGGNTATLAGDLNFAGRGRIFGMRANRLLPRWGGWDPRLTLGLDRRDYMNRCSIAGLPFGACGPAGESVTVTPLSLEWAAQRQGTWASSLQFGVSRNLPFGGGHASAAAFEASRTGAARGYTVLHAGATLGTRLAEPDGAGTGWQVAGRLNGQWASTPLVSGEQFGIGGAHSVRGYAEREMSGDHGWAASIEAVGPSWLDAPSGAGSLSPVFFVDAGWVRNRGDAPCADTRSTCTATSLGAGLRYALGNVAARLDVAWPLKDGARTERRHAAAHVAVELGF